MTKDEKADVRKVKLALDAAFSNDQMDYRPEDVMSAHRLLNALVSKVDAEDKASPA